jgi:uncharacterized protein (TIGR03118 family)
MESIILSVRGVLLCGYGRLTSATDTSAFSATLRAPSLAIYVAALIALSLTDVATAQTATLGYRQTNLSCRIQCDPPNKPDVLNNPWGIAFLPGQNFLITERDAGRVDSYDANGLLGPGLAVPLPAGSVATASRPTGIVADPVPRFSIGSTRFQFFVATEEGTIVGFNIVSGQFQDARVLVDRSDANAVFTGLTLLQPSCCTPVLAAANFHAGQVELFSLARTAYPGAFQDPNLPDGYSPYNIQTVGDQVFVTYAKKDDTGDAPLAGDGLGIVSVFDQEGNFIRRFASEGGKLNAPWGVTLTSASFGPFPSKTLISNTGDEGRILIYDPASANFLGSLTDSEGFLIANPGMHGLVFRGDHVSDGVGDPDNLYYTAASLTGSPNDGLFGAVQVGRLTTTQLTVPHAQLGVATTLTAEVHPVAGGDTATGTVDFLDNGDRVSVTLSGGIATLQHTYTTAGTHNVVAEYQGTDNLLKSFDLKQFVIGPATTTTLTGPATAVLGRPVTLVVRTLSDSGETVTGGISFMSGGELLVVVPLDAQGTARSDFIFHEVGTYSIVASYSGSKFQSSTSAPLQITAGGDFQFASVVPSLTIAAGQSADTNVTVSPTDGFAGPVTFNCLAPAGITCSFNPATLNVNGAAATTKVTVSSTSTMARNSHGLGFAFIAFGAFGTLLISRCTVAKKGVITLIVLLAVGGSLVACGGPGAQNSGGKQNPPQTFIVTLNATSGLIAHSTNISVTVQ